VDFVTDVSLEIECFVAGVDVGAGLAVLEVEPAGIGVPFALAAR